MNRRDAIRTARGTPLAMAAAGPAPTKFQLACMTLPYSSFPLERALYRNSIRGIRIRRVGYDAPKQSRT